MAKRYKGRAEEIRALRLTAETAVIQAQTHRLAAARHEASAKEADRRAAEALAAIAQIEGGKATAREEIPF